MLSRSDLHDYQTRAVDFIIDQKRSFLALDLGLGKSITSLTAIVDLIDSGAAYKVLIIAPLRVANSVWAQEAEKWKHTQHLQVSLCTGSEKKRLAALHKTADMYVINRENVSWLVAFYAKKWPFDCVVIDESSSFKSPSAKRFKALKKVIPHTDYCWLLSGTPTSNGLLDLWSQMYLVDFGVRLGRTVTNYRNRFFEQDYSGFNWMLREGSADKIHDIVDDKMLSMSSNDYLELPEKIDLVHTVTLPAKVLAFYKNFEKSLFADISGDRIEAVSAAVLANKLLQASNGFLYTDDKKNSREIHTEKLDALEEIVEGNQGENLLIAYNYKNDLERLRKRFPQAVALDSTQSTINDWNAGKIQMLLAHPASCGHGINLQRGGSVLVWFGLTWSLELYQQMCGRLHRQGQSKPVRVIHLVAEGCIDERVMGAILTKRQVQDALLEAIRENKNRNL